MFADEGDLYDELVNDSFALCRRMRTVSYWVGWVAVLVAVAGVVVFLSVLFPDLDRGEATYFGSGSPSVNQIPFQERLEAAVSTIPATFGWAALIGVLAAGLRLMARRLELDLVTGYSDDNE